MTFLIREGTTTVEIGSNLLTFLLAGVAALGSIVTSVMQYRQRKDMRPNGGASMRDAVNRIETHTASIAGAVSAPSADVVSTPINGTPLTPTG